MKINKKLIPWQLKVITKLLFGILKIDYKLLKKAKLVEHGKMENHEFAKNIYAKFENISKKYFSELNQSGNFCEIGPGDSLLSGVIASFNNFNKSYLVDAGSNEITNINSVKNLYKIYNKKIENLNISTNHSIFINSLLEECSIIYLTEGVNSLSNILSDDISFSFSNTVLQHIKKNEFNIFLKNLYRIHKKNSCSVHVINFSDHFSGGFNNLNIPDFIWESNLIHNANIYTNRIQLPEMITLFLESGFKIIIESYQIFKSNDITYPENLEFYISSNEHDIFNDKLIHRATITLIKL